MSLRLLLWLHDLRPELAGIEVTLLKRDAELGVAPREEVGRRLEVVSGGPAEASDWSSSV